MEKCCWTWKIHWQLHLARKMLCSSLFMSFPMQLCEFGSFCAQMCVHHVGRGWIWGAGLGGWQKAEGLDWLACDYSGCQVFTKRSGWGVAGGGGAETAAFTLYSKPHTQTHIHTLALTQRAGSVLETPQALQCVCLCYNWPLGPVAQTDRLTHIRPPNYSCAWCRLNGHKACGCWLTRSAEESNA